MKYPLEAMLRVRNMHEENAKREVRAAEKQLREAEEERQNKENELERYKKWLPEEEERRYTSIFGTNMNVAKLGDFRDGLAQLRQGVVKREGDLLEAQKVVQSCQKRSDAARNAAIVARRECMKLEKHKELWAEAMRKEEERIADLEMEESYSPSKKDADA